MDRRVTGISLVGLGAVLVLLIIGSTPADPTSAILVTGPFILIGATISFVGAWLGWADDPVGEYGEAILKWTLGSAVTFAAIGYLITLEMAVSQGTAGISQAVLQAFSAGTLAGILVGLYDARSQDRFDDLQIERERVEAFAHKSKSLNAYGKALYESQDIHDVSALSMEVLELLIESHGSAVLAVDEVSQVLDSTVPGDRSEFLRSAADAVADHGSMETVWIPDDIDLALPADMDVEEVLGVPIKDGDTTIVLLSLVASKEAYTDEDLDLLGSLSAHVGTALPNLERGVETLD